MTFSPRHDATRFSQMKVCPQCGERNSERARFCQRCAAPLGASPGRGDVRRVVTVLFSDIVDSTGLAFRLGPESFRRVMESYFEGVRGAVARHDGTIEKFIGDAVMAVFGIPELHEDDALRGVRAAIEMQQALQPLNRDLMERWNVTVSTRTALNTGEVVAGDVSLGQALVTGDAVHVAARLERIAGPGEILIGRDTHRLVREAVKVQPLKPVRLKGLERPVTPYRVIELAPAAAGAGRLDAPLVGRDHEIGLLYEAFERVSNKHRCELFTLLGTVGVGKTRLATEFLRGVENDALVLHGRCVSYGEASTFRPLADVVKQAAEISDGDSAPEARRKIAALIEGVPDASQASSHIGQLIGLKEMQGSAKDKFWAVGKLFESLAAERPVVVAFDDIHWAGATFLELVKDVVLLAADAPVLILCLARTEILEHHHGWLEEDANTASVLLAPLSDEECTRLVEYVLGRGNPSSEAQAQIVRSAQGNPLFLQETLAMLIDDGLLVDDEGRYVLKIDPSDIQVPPTIHALLAARLDRLRLEERQVIQSASVVGDLFYRSEVAHLLGMGSETGIEEHLTSLIGKELVRSERSRFPDDPAYRFHHTLIREVAYDALATDSRAVLHEAFARHLEESARGWSRSYQELVGYHYERAHLYRSGLGLDDGQTRALARRAVDHLASAGRKAHAGKDMPAAVRLIGRALAMLASDDPVRVELLPVLADALAELGDYGRAHQVATEAIEEARRTGRRGIESYALTVLLKLPRQPGFRLSLGYGIASETGFRARD